MRKTTIALAAATSALMVGGIAFAQSGSQPGERTPQTRDAVAERSAAMFARMDVNDDGVLNDTDREARIMQRFDRLDTDGDDMISRAEFAAGREATGERRAGRREARAQRRGGDRRMARRAGRHGGGKRMLALADANNDGTITRAEFDAATLARFDRVDSDKDGTISREERRAARQAMRASRRAD